MMAKMFNDHPRLHSVIYPLLNTYYFGTEPLCLRKSPELDASAREFQENDPRLTYQIALDAFEKALREAEDLVGDLARPRLGPA